MKRNPFDEFFFILPGPRDERSNWLWSPFHPQTLFCVLCAVAAMMLMSVLTRGG
jgi:hypothetical protein